MSDLAQYELCVILPPDMREDDMKARLNEIRARLTENGGKILQEDIAGLRDFAYRIKKFDRGFYAIFLFQHESTLIPELERDVRIEMAPLRYLLIRTPRHYFFKTLKEYDVEAEAAALKNEQERKANQNDSRNKMRRPMRKEKPDAPKSSEEIPATVEAPKAPEKVLSEEELQAKLKAEEAKLQSLLDNPDIQI